MSKEDEIREVRIRKNPNGWYTVERIILFSNSGASVEPSYHKYIVKAFQAARKWL